jgi:ABC-type antimicrobial peptide transport system permease subunit
VWSVNPNLPLARVRTLQQIYDESMAQTSFVLVILGIAASVTLLLGLVGIYGVIAYIVSQRRREVGIRMALGAQQHDVLWLVLGQGLHLGAFGALLGLGGSFVVMRLLDVVIPIDSPMRDPMMVAGVPVAGWLAAIIASVALLGVAMLACYLPARRATKVDPMEALRYE